MSFRSYEQVKRPFKSKKMEKDNLQDVELTKRYDALSDENMDQETTTDLPQDQNLTKKTEENSTYCCLR